MKPSRIFLVLALTVFLAHKAGFAQNTPTPSTTNNHYCSGNWYYDQAGPVPGIDSRTGGQQADSGADTPKAGTTPVKTENENKPPATDATYNERPEEAVGVVGDVGIKRDWIFVVFTALLFLATAMQALVAFRTFLNENRPHIEIKQIVLLNDPEADLIGVPVSVRVFLVNRGARTARIAEGNITLEFLSRSTFADLLKAGGDVTKLKAKMPLQDKKAGMPLYSEDRAALAGTKIKANDVVWIDQSVQIKPDDPHAYLAIADPKMTLMCYVLGW